MTPEQRSEARRKAEANRTPEQRKETLNKIREAQLRIPPEQRSEIAKKRQARKTPEQRSEAIRKGWETRRMKLAQLPHVENP
jgi:hypothetical protein